MPEHRTPNLNLFFEELAGQLGNEWYQVASDLYANLTRESQVWIRFAIWMLHALEEYADETARTHLEKVRSLYRRVLDGEQVTRLQWDEAQQNAYDAVSQSAGIDAWLLNVAGIWAAKGRGKSAFAVGDPVFTSIDNSCATQGYRLLLYLQLEQPPRDSTEAGLQRAVRENESTLPIYCDYLEEQGDAVTTWLRALVQVD